VTGKKRGGEKKKGKEKTPCEKRGGDFPPRLWTQGEGEKGKKKKKEGGEKNLPSSREGSLT